MAAHRGVPDPAVAIGNEAEAAATFPATCRMLNNRIRTFVRLPFASLDKPALRTRLDEIAERESGKPGEPGEPA